MKSVIKSWIGKSLSSRVFNNPVFIVGAGRSGTTVLLKALGQHQLILAMQGEAPFITSVGGSVYLFEYADSKEYYLKSLRVSKKYLYGTLKRMAYEVAAGEYYGCNFMLKQFKDNNI